MTIQRRRQGVPTYIWRSRVEVDRRGNEQIRAYPEDRLYTRVWIKPQRSARAEVPGQQQINITTVGFALPESEMGDVTLWSRVEMNGKEWDIASPPQYHHGTKRHSRHWSMDLRERP